MKWNEAKAKRKLDRLFSAYILNRDNRTCKWCGKSEGKMDCAHVIPRTCLALRWNPQNVTTLCFVCHKIKWHTNPLEAVEWYQGFAGQEHCKELLKLSRLPAEKFTKEKFEEELIKLKP